MTLHAFPGSANRRLADIVARYDGRAPRYTSFPTALQFGPQVDEAVYRGWLAALPPEEAVSIYVHVPFCARLCWYCGCNTRVVNRHEPVASYLDLMLREIALLGEALPGRLPARSVHLGGGSPNMLSVEELERLFAAFETTFDMTSDREVAAELDPTSLSPEWIAAAGRLGMNRASLGVQNLDPGVQAAINRHETFDQVAAAFGRLRDAGVRSLNVDLMYGLPLQTTANTLATIDAVATLRPDRIALFGYAHVPWMKAHQALINEADLPDAMERLLQSQAAADRLVELGYVRIGLDHFARAEDAMARALDDGSLRRNFQGYTTDEAATLLGVGASAIGKLPQGFVQNITPEIGWRAAVSKGRLPVARGIALTDDDRLLGEVIERLMCDFKVDLEAVRRRHGGRADIFDRAIGELAPFLSDHLAVLDGDVLAVTEEGRLVVRSICTAFDPYLEGNAGRHAKAI